jgi:hypothetical protein
MWDRENRRAARRAYRAARRDARRQYRASQRAYYQGRRNRGSFLPFLVLIVFFMPLLYSWLHLLLDFRGIAFGIVIALVIFAFILRTILARRSDSQIPYQPYNQPQGQETYQPSEQPYYQPPQPPESATYDKGYQPSERRESEHEPLYQSPTYSSEEQPQALYPQQQPPMVL